MQFECINRTCNDAVATTGALLHVNMYRKRHAYHTLVVVICRLFCKEVKCLQTNT
jgi:hypothetical protein